MAAEKSVADRNKEYWSSAENVYIRERKFVDELAAQWTQDLKDRLSWVGLPAQKPDLSKGKKPTRALDYACGPGMVSFALIDHVSSVRGVDISEGMVNMYNTRALEAGYSPDQLSSRSVDLVSKAASTNAELAGLEWYDFDYVCTANALHHFEDPVLATKRLVERLKPGGIFFVADIVPGPAKTSQDVWEGKVPAPAEGHHHGHHHREPSEDEPKHVHSHGSQQKGAASDKEDMGIAHIGFTKAFMEDLLQTAGCENVDTVLLDNTMKLPASIGGMEKRIFFARGTKRF